MNTSASSLERLTHKGQRARASPGARAPSAAADIQSLVEFDIQLLLPGIECRHPLLFGLLRRFTAKARAVWTITAMVAALLSLGGPLSATASAGTKVSLVAMHLTVAAVLIVVLRRTTI